MNAFIQLTLLLSSRVNIIYMILLVLIIVRLMQENRK